MTYIPHWAREAFDDCPPMEWLVDELLPAEGVGMIFGDPGSKKTWTMLHMACCVAMGGEWLGRPVRQGPVLIVDEESGENRMRRRLRAVMKGLNAPLDIPVAFLCLQGIRPGDELEISLLHETIDIIRPVLVMIDALADVSEGDENSKKDMQPVMNGLRFMADKYHCHVCTIHHPNKAGEVYRGNSVILASVDTSVQVKSAQNSGDVEYVISKCRDGELGAFKALAKFDGFDLDMVFRLEGGVASKKYYPNSKQHVLDFLNRNGTGTIDQIKSGSSHQSSVEKSVYELRKEGVIERVNGGGNGQKAIYGLAALPRRLSLDLLTITSEALKTSEAQR